MPETYLILGGGFTGQRVARTLLSRGDRVFVTSRSPGRLAELAESGAETLRVDVSEPATLAVLGSVDLAGARILHSVPALHHARGYFDPTPTLLAALRGRPQRMVYLSTTGVYGDRTLVDHTTAPAPTTPRQKVRLDAEQAMAAGPWSSLVLRPGAIYGPGRGIHVNLREGRYRLVGDGRNVVSRIHVADFAALTVAALDTDLTGAYPVADDEPCEAREIAAFCTGLLGLSMPPSTSPDGVPESLRVTRRVDGREIRRLLGIKLRYPSFRVGLPACLAEEER